MAILTVYEQLFLELVNRDRADPVAAAAAQGYDLNDGVTGTPITTAPKQPLAFSIPLLDSSDDHSVDQVNNDYFSHTGLDGSSPSDRMEAAGYAPLPFVTYSTGENLAGRSSTAPIPIDAALIESMHDGLFDSPGHRSNILKDSFSEVGIGVYSGVGDIFNNGFTYSAVATQNFADGGRMFITGVVIDDGDNDAFYDIGEGLSGISVSVTGPGFSTTASTYHTGGYSVEVPSNGTYTVTFSGAALGETVTETVNVSGQNVKVDAFASSGSEGEPTSGPDNLMGTSGADSIAGLGGADTIFGYRGDDSLNGGAGDDQIFGGGDNDRLWGLTGNDLLEGNTGNDRLLGGDGNDTANGGDGNDTIIGGEGNDTATGGVGDDSIIGEAGRDHIIGDDGSDTLEGGTWADSVAGGASADSVKGNGGPDTLAGHTGHDTVSGGGGDDSVDGNRGRDQLVGGAGNDTVNGGNGTDTLTGNDGRDLMNGGSASDRLYGSAGRDTLNGGLDNDTLSGGSGADLYVLEPGTDVDTVVFDGRDAFDLTAYNFTNAAFQSIYNNATGGSGSTLVLDLGGGDELRVRVDAGVSDPLLSDFMI